MHSHAATKLVPKPTTTSTVMPTSTNIAPSSTAAAYDKSQTDFDTAPNNECNLSKAIYIALALAYARDIQFRLDSKTIVHDTLDDIVVISRTAIAAIQHHSRAKKQSLSGFLTQSTHSELTFYQYFDSLYDALGDEKREGQETLVHYYFCTNNLLPEEIKDCLAGSQFSPDFYAASNATLRFMRNLFYASIVKYSTHHTEFYRVDSDGFDTNSLLAFAEQCLATRYLIQKTRTDLQMLCRELKEAQEHKRENVIQRLKTLLQTTPAVQRITHDISLWDLYCIELSYPHLTKITQFFQHIKFHFQDANLIAYEAEIKEFIRQQFNATNDALYFAFFWEFRTHFIGRETIVYTPEQVKELFTRWYTKCIHSERLSTLTQCYLKREQTSQVVAHFTRDNELEQIQQFLSCTNLSLLLISGLSGIGKTSLIRDVFKKNNHNDGEYLFLDSSTLADYMAMQREKDLTPLSNNLRVIFLDNAERIIQGENNQEVLNLINTFLARKIKVVLLFRTEYAKHMQLATRKLTSITQSMQVQPLNLDQVIAQYPQLTPLVIVESFKLLMSNPFFLKLIVQYNDELVRNELSTETNIKKLQDFLIHLLLHANAKRTKEREMLLRSLIYRAQDNPLPITDVEVWDTAEELIKIGVLVENRHHHVCFAHAFYDEYVVRQSVEKCLRDAVAKDEIQSLFLLINEKLQQPLHKKIAFQFLINNSDFNSLVKKVNGEVFDLNDNPFILLLLFGIKNQQDILVTACCEALHYLAFVEPKKVLNAIIFFLKIKPEERKLSNEQLTEIIFGLRICAVQNGCFNAAYQLLLDLVTTKDALPEVIVKTLREQLPEYCCHSGFGADRNFQERREFIVRKFSEPLKGAEEDYLYMALYMASNPDEHADLGLTLQLEFCDTSFDNVDTADMDEQGMYAMTALNLLIAIANESVEKAQTHLIQILKDNMGAVLRFISDEDPERGHYLTQICCYILERIPLTEAVAAAIKQRKAELLSLDATDRARLEKSGTFDETHEFYSSLLRKHLGKVQAILDQKRGVSKQVAESLVSSISGETTAPVAIAPSTNAVIKEDAQQSTTLTKGG